MIEIFNDRFFVPFKLVPKNFREVVLGQEPILSVGFTFEDGADTASVEHADLLATFSTGEKKALYILNIIFDIWSACEPERNWTAAADRYQPLDHTTQSPHPGTA
ncbi:MULTISPECIES: hypothetical protein [unclassified Mesorhizobium]|uniref:hypothetical protein n=1 Tax=unclassified Mesorhizobium TaxID=325217 RepID=UPI000FCCC64B|nr:MULTISPECIES: hypothetical protein [unclassified Mesorhizobium]RUV64984.1 hypothetical protein EOA85_00670 [Mesorhizobium sp. M5C.F.Ca.IN.020.29.1.1]RWK59756.1 MAG: hypothetical protein EOR49_24480 [Mesorhizobium sp.]RWM44416.1 MAG: hypothetical protein EOR76_24875 [Mesorhizobium sp.]RWM49159.1 MAG: hypothetical protein EOR78_28210 [Mesorhizobium sp.]RWM54057.1 MAG: hypothetical protein EOR79_25195 [Mesorhizobium sp.]